jgi:uncharacterized protein (TIGR03083 family)
MAGVETGRGRAGIAAQRRAHDSLAALVGRLDAEALRARSGASEWNVADVLSHLGSAAEIGLGTLTTGRADPDGMTPIWDRWNAMSPEEKSVAFVTSEARLVEALEALSDEDLERKRLDLGFLPQPITIDFFNAMRLSEVGLHRWDIDVAFDPAATVPAVTVPFILDGLPNFVGFLAKPTGSTGAVAVSTTDPDRHYRLEIDGPNASLLERQASGAATSLSLPAEAFLRLTAGRLAPTHTPSSVRVSGDLTLDDLRQAFPGY